MWKCDIMARTSLDMNSRNHKSYLAISLLVCVRASVCVCVCVRVCDFVSECDGESVLVVVCGSVT